MLVSLISNLDAIGNKIELIETIQVYIEENGDINRVADKLNIHRNTLNYRLERINKLTGKNPNLKLEAMVLGKQTKTEMCVAYIKGIVDEKILEEVKSRLQKIDIDSILESGYIESFIEAFQSSEDYYSPPYYSSVVRCFRWLAFFLSIYLPSLYVALVTYHQSLIPSELIISMSSALEDVPFPAVVEALLMQVVYEILREAGVRLPRPIGQSVSIVGAIVIGEASVSAGIIGAPMVIVVELTAITSFVVPPLTDVNLMCRLFLLLLSGVAGFYGVILGTAFILTHICSLRSFGIPYTSPIAPLELSDMKDSFIRLPWWTFFSRPRSLRSRNPIRQGNNNMPNPPI